MGKRSGSGFSIVAVFIIGLAVWILSEIWPIWSSLVQ